MANHITVSSLVIVTYVRGVICMGEKCLINLEKSDKF